MRLHRKDRQAQDHGSTGHPYQLAIAGPDDLDRYVARRTKKNANFPKLVDDALLRREMARNLAARRESAELSQAVVAARMGTSASVVSKLEAGGDVKLSTLQRYCAAVGYRFALKAV